MALEFRVIRPLVGLRGGRGLLELKLQKHFMEKSKNTKGPTPTPDNAKKSCPGRAGAQPGSSTKRKAEDLPSLMGSSPFTSWSPFRRFEVISSTLKDQPVASLSPFKIQRELVKILGSDAFEVSKLNSGLMVELRSLEQLKKLESISTFVDIPVTVSAHKSLNSSRGVIRHRDLRDCSETEIVEEMANVTHARRISVRRGEDMVKTDTIVLTFDSPKPPTTIRAGYLSLNVRPYIPTPMRCYKCHRYGHGKEYCKKTSAVCVRCGKTGHPEADCSADPFCINCRGDHPASSKSCPKFLEEQAILRFRAEHGGTFKEARKAVIVYMPKSISERPFSDVARANPTAKPAAPPKVSGKSSASAKSKGEKAQNDSPASCSQGAAGSEKSLATPRASKLLR